MNKKIVELIIILIILSAAGVGVYYLMTMRYKEFRDENIQVEILTDLNFTVNTIQDEYGDNRLYHHVSEFEKSVFDVTNAMFDSFHV